MEHENELGNVHLSRDYWSFFIIHPALHPDGVVPPQPRGDSISDIPETVGGRPPYHVRHPGERTVLVLKTQGDLFLVHNTH